MQDGLQGRRVGYGKRSRIAVSVLSSSFAACAALPSCWRRGFNFHHCCLMRHKSCFDETFTYERCCPEHAVSCWSGPFTFEQCCLTNSTACWDDSGHWSYERCCVPDLPQAFEPESQAVCSKDLVGTRDAPDRLPDEAIEVSSVWANDPGHGYGTLWRSRLIANVSVESHDEYEDGTPWCAAGSEANEYIQWDFRGHLFTITAIRIAGRSRVRLSLPDQFVTRFRLLVDAGSGWNWYDDGKELEGNSNGVEIVTVPLIPFAAYRVRLNPSAWHRHICLRGTLLGCHARQTPAEVSLVYCWPKTSPGPDLRGALHQFAKVNDWEAVLTVSNDAGSCFLQIHRIITDLKMQGRMGRLATVVISPLALQFVVSQHAIGIKRAVMMFKNYPPEAVNVVGLPQVGLNKRWTWPVRRIRREFWKLQYSDYPTGFKQRLLRGYDTARCFGGDTTSGTRVYRSSTLTDLLRHVDPIPDAAWLVNLDMETQRQGHGTTVFTCAFCVLQEEDYTHHANLTDALATRYEIEAARFYAEGPVHINCQITPSDGNVYQLIHGTGVSAPWCFRYVLREAWRALASWWKSLTPRHYVVASDGTALTLLRNSRSLMPWDFDVDALLCSEDAAAISLDALSRSGGGKVLMPHATPEIEARDAKALDSLRAAGFKWRVQGDYRFRGAGLHLEMDYTITDLRPGPRTVTIDAVFKQYTDVQTWPFTADIAGVEVRLSSDLIELLVAIKYDASDKRIRDVVDEAGVAHDEVSLTCRGNKHSACLPECGMRPLEQLCATEAECDIIDGDRKS